MLEQLAEQQKKEQKLQKIVAVIVVIIVALGVIGYFYYFTSGSELKDISRDLVTKIMRDNDVSGKCVKIIDVEGKAHAGGAIATAVLDDGSTMKIRITQRLANNRRETEVAIIGE